MTWQCSKGHIWEATSISILENRWCKKCSFNQPTIQELKEIAQERGGLLISTEYIGSESKLNWICSNGHSFSKNFYEVRKGSWCKYCSKSIGEEICRLYFEGIFNKPFPKVRPNWLKSEKGNNLELDGYNEELKLAFEHQGIYHYEFLPFFHQSLENFEAVKARDLQKKSTCSKLGVTLIVIPEIGSLLKEEDLKKFLIKELKIHNYKTNINIEKTEISLSLNSFHFQKKLEKAIQHASIKEGELLSNSYLGAFTKLKWRCKEGHTWDATPANVINQNSWCPKCANRQAYTMKDVVDQIKEKEGLCLTKKYINKQSKLDIICNEGHLFRTSFTSILNGVWCRKCSGRYKLEIEDMHLEALKHKGECLSNQYVNSSSKLRWKCYEGHEFELEPTLVRQGRWCKECSRNKLRDGLSAMSELAQEFGGKCISEKYTNNKTKLLWECSIGHQWLEEPRHVRHLKRWCPVCKTEKVIL